MNRYEAVGVICKIINSGIISEDVEDELNELIDCICERGFEPCPNECLRLCKLDECPNAKA